MIIKKITCKYIAYDDHSMQFGYTEIFQVFVKFFCFKSQIKRTGVSPSPNHTIIIYTTTVTKCRLSQDDNIIIYKEDRSSRTSYDRYERVLFLSYDCWTTRDDGRQPVVKGRVRRDGQHGRLLPRGLFADSPDPVETNRPEHKPDDHVHRTSDTAKNAIKSPKPRRREACILYNMYDIKV